MMINRSKSKDSREQAEKIRPVAPHQPIVKAIESDGIYRVVPVNPPKSIIPGHPTGFFEALHNHSA